MSFYSIGEHGHVQPRWQRHSGVGGTGRNRAWPRLGLNPASPVGIIHAPCRPQPWGPIALYSKGQECGSPVEECHLPSWAMAPGATCPVCRLPQRPWGTRTDPTPARSVALQCGPTDREPPAHPTPTAKVDPWGIHGTEQSTKKGRDHPQHLSHPRWEQHRAPLGPQPCGSSPHTEAAKGGGPVPLPPRRAWQEPLPHLPTASSPERCWKPPLERCCRYRSSFPPKNSRGAQPGLQHSPKVPMDPRPNPTPPKTPTDHPYLRSVPGGSGPTPGPQRAESAGGSGGAVWGCLRLPLRPQLRWQLR